MNERSERSERQLLPRDFLRRRLARRVDEHVAHLHPPGPGQRVHDVIRDILRDQRPAVLHSRVHVLRLCRVPFKPNGGELGVDEARRDGRDLARGIVEVLSGRVGERVDGGFGGAVHGPAAVPLDARDGRDVHHVAAPALHHPW